MIAAMGAGCSSRHTAPALSQPELTLREVALSLQDSGDHSPTSLLGMAVAAAPARVPERSSAAASECAICLCAMTGAGVTMGKVTVNDVCATLACGHTFHRACIGRWLGAAHTADTCPICRAQQLPQHGRSAFRFGGEVLMHGRGITSTAVTGESRGCRRPPPLRRANAMTRSYARTACGKGSAGLRVVSGLASGQFAPSAACVAHPSPSNSINDVS